jgi:hypothetical protein
MVQGKIAMAHNERKEKTFYPYPFYSPILSIFIPEYPHHSHLDDIFSSNAYSTSG